MVPGDFYFFGQTFYTQKIQNSTLKNKLARLIIN